MAGVERLELPTIGFGDRCSTNWNYTPATDSNYTDAQPKVKGLLINNPNCLAVWLLNKQKNLSVANLLLSAWHFTNSSSLNNKI